MPNSEPIKSYLRAKEALNKGERKTAATLLANALGSKESNPVLEDSLDQLLQNDSLANDVVLKILSSEVANGKRGH